MSSDWNRHPIRASSLVSGGDLHAADALRRRSEATAMFVVIWRANSGSSRDALQRVLSQRARQATSAIASTTCTIEKRVSPASSRQAEEPVRAVFTGLHAVIDPRCDVQHRRDALPEELRRAANARRHRSPSRSPCIETAQQGNRRAARAPNRR
jgi:hypothetical protein